MISSVTTKCWILSLFIRDDGERLLLGDGAYEFKKKQQHFKANTIINDAVDIQGNDGTLLAGQVRRASTQSFDGYVGDATSTPQEIEQYRRNFFAFFLKNHYYEVVYIFQDGTAIKRQKGFLVDAPEVKELFQISPEYHVSLNFEDVNYYEYNENAEGQEVYGESATIPLSSIMQGGQVWDEDGLVWEIGGLYSVNKLAGNTSQAQYTGKNLFDINGDIMSSNSTYQITDDTIKVTQASSSNSNALVGIKIPNSSNLLGKTITISLNAKSFSGATGGRAILFDDALSTAYITLNNPDADGNMSGTVTIPNSFPSGSTFFRLFLYTNRTNSGGAAGAYTIFSEVQIEIGQSKTSYEIYVGGSSSPRPDMPQTVNVVTGLQTIAMTDSSNVTTTYNLNLGDMELCKIGNHQDYIYKNGDNWYVHKVVNKVVLNGTEDWAYNSASSRFNLRDPIADLMLQPYNASAPVVIISDYFTGSNWWNVYEETVDNAISTHDSVHTIEIRSTNFNSAANFKTWLSSNNVNCYYIMTEATDTQITDANILSSLEQIASEEYAMVTVSSSNLPIILQSSGVISGGQVWEEGGGGGAVNIQVDSIDTVYPVLTITGPANSPVVENITTNTRIEFNGNIAESQTLVVDSRAQTAKLNGTSVINKVSGDWLVFAPGINRVSYTATNDTAPDATIEWAEVVG